MMSRFTGCTNVAEEAAREVAGERRQHAGAWLVQCMLFLVEVSMCKENGRIDSQWLEDAIPVGER